MLSVAVLRLILVRISHIGHGFGLCGVLIIGVMRRGRTLLTRARRINKLSIHGLTIATLQFPVVLTRHNQTQEIDHGQSHARDRDVGLLGVQATEIATFHTLLGPIDVAVMLQLIVRKPETSERGVKGATFWIGTSPYQTQTAMGTMENQTIQAMTWDLRR